MKKRSLGKKLLFAGSILTVAFACQPKTPNANSSQKPAETQSDQDDDEAQEKIIRCLAAEEVEKSLVGVR